ncbi:hypothetical protein [Denitratimonas sp. CY0512]|uniref:hypothetical protein n=1 Tax=Denitratimonas sp. CY0512 TaxID=3131940 RepID=UPI0030B627A8
MTVDASIPKALYQANIDLALRIAALLQENGKQWFDLFAEEASTRFDEGVSSFGALGSEFSLEKLAALPADAAAQFLQLDVGRWQAMISHAVENQTLFSDGLQEALREWQAACSEAFDAVGSGVLPNLGGGLSALPGFSDVAMGFQRFMAQAVPSVSAVYSASVGGKADKTAEKAKPASTAAARSAGKKPAAEAQPGNKLARKPAAKAASKPVKKTAKKAATKAIAKTATSAKKSAAKTADSTTGTATSSAATAKPVARAAAAAKKTSSGPPRKSAGSKSAAPVPPPSPMPALVTTPRKTAKSRSAETK